jgi:hypothetical protein
MGWFSDAINAVSDTVEDVANAVGEFGSDVVETVGNVIEDGLDWLGGDIPILSDVLGWLGGVVSGIFDFVGAVIKGALGIVGGVIGGLIRIVGGILSLDGDLILEGLGDIGSSIAGAEIVIIGKFVSLVQHFFLLQAKERKLTDDEIRDLKRVFRDSLAYYNIRLIEGCSGLYGINGRAFVLGNTIYLKDNDVGSDPGLLVHECTHVWQYQNLGARYSSDALYAQAFVDDEYSWEAEVNRGNEEWVDFNMEAQGAFLEDVYNHGLLLARGTTIGTGKGVFYDADSSMTRGRFEFNSIDHTQRANDAVIAVRGESSQRLSIFI